MARVPKLLQSSKVVRSRRRKDGVGKRETRDGGWREEGKKERRRRGMDGSPNFLRVSKPPESSILSQNNFLELGVPGWQTLSGPCVGTSILRYTKTSQRSYSARSETSSEVKI